VRLVGGRGIDNRGSFLDAPCADCHPELVDWAWDSSKPRARDASAAAAKTMAMLYSRLSPRIAGLL
jgi:hypothetical protein